MTAGRGRISFSGNKTSDIYPVPTCVHTSHTKHSVGCIHTTRITIEVVMNLGWTWGTTQRRKRSGNDGDIVCPEIKVSKKNYNTRRMIWRQNKSSTKTLPLLKPWHCLVLGNGEKNKRNSEPIPTTTWGSVTSRKDLFPLEGIWESSCTPKVTSAAPCTNTERTNHLGESILCFCPWNRRKKSYVRWLGGKNFSS